jgi:hypothetical protein
MLTIGCVDFYDNGNGNTPRISENFLVLSWKYATLAV